MAIKIVIADVKAGKSLQKELEDSKFLMGKKIGETFKGESIDLAGYEFEITGGSDASGFPMRKDVDKTGRFKVLATQGVGVKKKRHGQKIRKNVAGGIIGVKTAQLNVKTLKYGPTSLFEESKAEEAKEEVTSTAN